MVYADMVSILPRYTVLLNATSRKDAKGSIVGVVGVGQDITFLSKAMAESRRVADDLTRLIETAKCLESWNPSCLLKWQPPGTYFLNSPQELP